MTTGHPNHRFESQRIFEEPPRDAVGLSTVFVRRHPDTGWTLMHYLAALGADDALAVLLSHPMCPVDMMSDHGSTPLDLALLRGHRVAARMIFCARGAPPAARTGQQRTGRRRPGAGGSQHGDRRQGQRAADRRGGQASADLEVACRRRLALDVWSE